MALIISTDKTVNDNASKLINTGTVTKSNTPKHTMETITPQPIKISKKELIARSYITVYKGSGQRFPAIYFDWQQDENFQGYKYLMVGFMVTKKELVDRMHHYLTTGMIGWSPDYRLRIASDDSKRFKAQLSGAWTFAGNS